MKKRLIGAALAVLMSTTILAGCGSSEGDKAASGEAGKAKLKVGMTTDVGTIDDKSFNQGTWEGIEKAGKELEIDEPKYLKPKAATDPEYLTSIGNLYDGGYKMIVMPGYKFETAAYQVQNKYKDAKFVLIDGQPKETKESEGKVGENTVSIFYAEEQSGFLAGVATALEIKEGDLGFIGGLKIPPVQRFNWGFQQGVKYANENLGTKTTLKKENVQYAESFDDVSKGQQMASTMYDRGVKAIFASAGKVGVGVINEAKTRMSKGKTSWVVGVDVDQYADGVYSGDKSVVLTSAMKYLGKSAYDMINAELKGEFPGGKTLTFDIKNDGVGIPEKNPNLSEETVAKVNEVKEKMKKDEIKVSAKKTDDLIE